jgi:gliding motility-associated-like protein
MRLNLIHIIWILYSVFVFNNAIYGQCDVSISSWDAASGDITIEAINSENCGCNEFTTEGNTCETSSSPYVANNATISHIVLALHVEGLDSNWGCTNAINHPGWTFKAFTLFGNQVLESGDTWSANVYDAFGANDCWAEILANDTLCSEVVVWQINLSRTASTAEGGWAVNGGGALQTQNYPDVDLSNNTAIYCAPPACDTVYVDIEVIEYLTDTIIEYVDVEWVTTDTVIEYVNVIDTLYWYEYITVYDTIVLTEVDTLIEYIQLPPDTVYEYSTDTITLIETEYIEVVIENYIYTTDTITEFVAITTYIDCETGEQCGELSPCDETSIYAPNVVTPNNDGWNDTWQIIADGACWGQWEVRIYNRWGGLVWISTSSLDEWDANVASGVYIYTITAHSSMNASVVEFNGTVTVLY